MVSLFCIKANQGIPVNNLFMGLSNMGLIQEFSLTLPLEGILDVCRFWSDIVVDTCLFNEGF